MKTVGQEVKVLPDKQREGKDRRPLARNTDYGTLQKIAYHTMRNYLHRKGMKVNNEVLQDSVQDVLLYLFGTGKWEGLSEVRDKAEETGKPPIVWYCRLVRNAYRRELSHLVMYRPESISLSLDNDAGHDYLPANYIGKPCRELLAFERTHVLRETLEERTFRVAQGIVAGYTQEEIAHALGISRSTVCRDISRIKLAYVSGAV